MVRVDQFAGSPCAICCSSRSCLTRWPHEIGLSRAISALGQIGCLKDWRLAAGRRLLSCRAHGPATQWTPSHRHRVVDGNRHAPTAGKELVTVTFARLQLSLAAILACGARSGMSIRPSLAGRQALA